MRDLFGGEAAPAGRQRPARPARPGGLPKPVVAATQRAPAWVEPVAQPQVNLPASAVESFVALRAAVCLSSAAAGTVWLVPEYTAELRPEISAVDLTRLAATLQMFPGARVAEFTNLKVNTPPSTRAYAHTTSVASPETRHE